jgi:3-mercaptopropionate dioxygenase
MCRTAELDELVIAVRAAIARSAGWRDAASCVAAALRENLPPADRLPADLLDGERGTYRSRRLHVEPDGSFSMVAIAWQPGALTRIHDHVTWCVFGAGRALSPSHQLNPIPPEPGWKAPCGSS